MQEVAVSGRCGAGAGGQRGCFACGAGTGGAVGQQNAGGGDRPGLEHLTGVKLSASTLHREAWRQGQRAQKVRAELDAQAARASARQLELCLEPYPVDFGTGCLEHPRAG